MYFHELNIHFLTGVNERLLFVTPIPHINIQEAVYEWCRKNNTMFPITNDVEILRIIKVVSDDICAAHGFFKIKDTRNYPPIVEKQETKT